MDGQDFCAFHERELAFIGFNRLSAFACFAEGFSRVRLAGIADKNILRTGDCFAAAIDFIAETARRLIVDENRIRTFAKFSRMKRLLTRRTGVRHKGVALAHGGAIIDEYVWAACDSGRRQKMTIMAGAYVAEAKRGHVVGCIVPFKKTYLI